MSQQIVVFIHGWSVTHTNTYGQLPTRLRAEARAQGVTLVIKDIYLGEYVSFEDSVRVEDISRGLEAAVGHLDLGDSRFVAITHSTGGPVVRDWWNRFYLEPGQANRCPMSHLIMLAPANFGSALAILGKQRIGRLKSWFAGVEPGTGVLDWLELGSADAWTLNTKWIHSDGSQIGPKGVFPFVITGEWIDRKLYDHVNPYTGELGSDGVVRVCAANMCSRYIRLEQSAIKQVAETSLAARTLLQSLDRRARRGRRIWVAPDLTWTAPRPSPEVPLLVVKRKSHSGTSIGILRSVKAGVGNKADAQTVRAILDCMRVKTRPQYAKLVKDFRAETKRVQEAEDERIEREDRFLLPDRLFIRDRHSMIVFRLRDDEGNAVTDYDLLLTASNPHRPQLAPDPNFLPPGLIVDRQLNSKHGNTLSLYFNYQALVGLDELRSKGEIVRHKQPPAARLGILIRPRPVEGAVHFLPCELQASQEVLKAALQPNQTTLIDVVLRRVVREGVFRLKKGTKARSFKRDSRGKPL